MPKDPYAVLHALLRAESVRERRSPRTDAAPAETRTADRPQDQRPDRQGGDRRD
ncbi:hypothetical protein H9Y04_15695 [Streptomyces sp. TRM66268-LWL]|uniref:Uncharacterized protein n=1 Tax=Streptomyces polyasparticus TaxID=2767826 RepID=A0ABR7SH02_9ACTN|nr:hypothetical protein [Streptomyces polyasparticus]MBC9714010.1 hypothetical protein [Streptomyces polyasparticus]